MPRNAWAHNLATSALRCRVSIRSRACALPPTVPCSSSRPVFFLFSGSGPRRRRRRAMSTSASGSQKAPKKAWPRYGDVPLVRCPQCRRPDPLKRLVCKYSDIGNVGREFVKCESKACLGEDGEVRFVPIWRNFDYFTLYLGIRVCVSIFSSCRPAVTSSGWTSTSGFEGLKLKSSPKSNQ